ncbi:MAG: MATE family efflux transporter [Vicinamibacterales bacterium]
MQDLTTGSLSGHLLKTTSFMLVSMIFQTLYVLVDLYWVGSLGTDAVAAVGISGNLTFIVLAVSQMLGVGATTRVAHASGRKDHEQAVFLFNQAQVLSVTAGFVFWIVAMLLQHDYVNGMSADAETNRLANEYLLWFIPAMALQFAIVAMGAALRGTGNFKPGMIVQTGTVLLNIVLAPFLIFGWGTGYAMGVSGAAVATFVSVVVGVVWISLYFFDKNAYLRFHFAHWRPQLRIWGDMLKIGLPAGIEFALMAVYLMVVYAVSRPFGAQAQAGFGIGMRIMQSMFMPIVALGFAVAPVAGQNFAARRGDRVREAFRQAALMSLIATLACTALAQIAPRALIGFFTADQQAIDIGETYLRIVSLTFSASGITFVTASMFQAMGNTIPSMATSFARIIIVAIPAVFLAQIAGFELRWIWYLTVVATFTQVSLNVLLLRREFRVRLHHAPAMAQAQAVAADV